MRVAVVNLTSGGLSGGYRKYLARLMPLLKAHPRVTSLTVFVPEAARQLLAAELEVRTWPAADARRGYAALRRDVAELAPDVVFIPTARHAAFGGVPVVTMIRNMEPLTVPFAGHTVREATKNFARAWAARRAVRRSARVIAVSHHVRDFLVDQWHIAPSRIGVTYHGVDRHEPVPRPAAGPLFTAGSIRPARGLEDILLALARLPEAFRLVIAGAVDDGCGGHAAALRALAHARGIEHRITWTGHLSAAAMAAQFGEAMMFVMTSRAEACPNIALEAMSLGCPIVSTNQAPMPEFFGSAALYYDAGDAAALADRIERMAQDPSYRTRLGADASLRAAGFTWQATCEGTVLQLEQAR